MTLDTTTIRAGFPALSRSVGSRTAAYLDGPGGTQVHQSVIDAMTSFMARGGSNSHGPFVTSVETDEVVRQARSAVADLFGADPNEIVFGQNMTSLTYAMSRALSRTWSKADNIVLTRLDHDANVAPWIQAADTVGAEVRFVDFDPDSGCSLDFESLTAAIDDSTTLVAFTLASNATGTVTPAARVVELAHAAGALTYADAVHFAPHGSLDVKALDTDFLVSSSYKWFGPHTGCLFGKAEHLEHITPFKLRPSPDSSPDRWETGTQSFESLAGVTAAVNYLASLGDGLNRREQLIDAYRSIAAHETQISERFLAGAAEMPSLHLYGRATAENRTPTFAIEIDGHDPDDIAAALGDLGVFVWSGNYYAYEVMEALDKPKGLVRIGFVHYNTIDEVDRALAALESFT